MEGILGLLSLMAVLLGYCVYNFHLIRKSHETLLQELKYRLFFAIPNGKQIDLMAVVKALCAYSKVRIEVTDGIKIVKE